jgi:hypothetical protein
MDIISTINRAAQKSRLRAFWGQIAEILWLERIDIWTIDLTARPQEAQMDFHESVVFSMGDADTIREMSADVDLQIGRKDVLYCNKLLEEGSRLLIGRADGKPVFYGLIAFARKRMWSKYFALHEDEAFIMRCFTLSTYRGRGIYPQAICRICDDLAQQGVRLAYLDVASHNEASIRGVIKAGARRCTSYYLRLRLLGRDVVIPRGPLKCRFV